jgi:hypothetical protein
MSNLFEFGEQVNGYEVRVLNERAVRASAGILFLFAMIAFMNAWLMGNFQPTRVFVVAFLFDFTIRIFINPRYAPSLIVGQWIVRHQQAEYVGAPQKRFAWAIGFALALTMLYLMVINHVIGPINLIVCSACLLLLFFESAFGICIGCKIYNLFYRDKAQLCAGGSCEVPEKKHSTMSIAQFAMVCLFAGVIAVSAKAIYGTAQQNQTHDTQQSIPESTTAIDPAEVERCKVPDFAKAMGHEEKWKLHHNCK